MNFIIEQYENRSYLTYPLSAKAGTDPMLTGMLLNNRISGFAPFSIRTNGDKQSLCYDIHELRSMKEIFAEPISRHTLLNTFDEILAALETAQDYMIESSSVVLDPQYVFLNPTHFSTALICLPLMEYQNGNDEKSFFKSIMFNATFDYNEPCDHVARIMNYLNGSEFVSADFRKLLGELGANRSSAEKTPVPQADPFFDFDAFLQAGPEPQAIPELPTAPAHKTTMEEADAIFSAALLRTYPSEGEKEQKPQQINLIPEPANYNNDSSVTVADSPLSIAEQLLSAALTADPSSQKKVDEPTTATPSLQKKADEPTIAEPAMSSVSPEESGNSARSRRSRARRESRESHSAQAPVSTQDPPKAPKPDVSTSFDFLDDFAVSGNIRKTDAMKAADDILSALTLPTKGTKDVPAFDPFADYTPTKDVESPEIAEDSFSDFTTPIVRSRKKDGTSTPKQTTASRKKESSSAPSQKEDPVEMSFDFSMPSKKPVAATDAMKVADDLLSAALAGATLAPVDIPAKEPVKASTSTPVSPVSPAKVPERSSSYNLEDFSTSPMKKTRAMMEAEAILDSLDLFAAVPDLPQSPAMNKGNSTPASLRKEEPPAQQEPAHKGGFFSTLRRKEVSPAPVPQTPSQPVIPYFGSDGETTILNVSQQMAKPSAPYLVRSSNQETVILSKPVFRIGKDRDFTDYCICDNSAVSRRHANLLVRNGDVFIIDTNSTNHTFVNGVMIRNNTEVKLTHGDEIRLANEDFMLYCAGTF